MIVCIPQEEYDELLYSRDKLYCLESCGVGNWDGWDDAMDMFRELKGEEE